MGGRFTTSNDDRYKFTGHELDEEAGLDLSYAGARYLDSEIGTWLSIDPLADSYPGWSPYNYTMGNPVNMIDPDGRAAQGCCIGQGIAWSNAKAVERGGGEELYANTQRRGKEDIGFLIGVAAIASTVVPGPEDVAIGAFMLTKTGQAISRFGGRIGGAISGLFKKNNSVEEAGDLVNFVPDGKEANHIFSGRTGKFSDTPENRSFLEDISSDKNNLVGVDEYGKEWYSYTREDGSQVYIYAQDGKIKGAGINDEFVDLKERYNLEE